MEIREFSYKKIVLPLILMFGFVGVSVASDSGDSKDGVIQKLMNKVDQLEQKVENLTNKLNAYEQKPAATVSDEAVAKKVDEIMAQKEAKSSPMISMPKISGFIDTIYNYNFHKPLSQTTKIGTPKTTTAGPNNVSSFATRAHDITFNAAQVALTGSLKDANYVIKIEAGSDANVIHPLTGAGTAGSFDLEEAYFTTPLFNSGVNLKLGKFVTLEGIEVIESPSDPTISRGYLFGMAEPFTHVGFLLSRPLPIKGLELRAGLVNGWDVLTDNNTGKTVVTGLGINYGDLATGGLSVYYGPEQTGNNSHNRTSVDLTVATKPLSQLTLNLQGNWGQEGGISKKVDQWDGYGVQPVWQFTDKFSLGGRIEHMENKLGSRFGTSGGKLTNFTITPTYKLNGSITTRIEYRHDMANKSFFEGKDGVFDQKTLDQMLAEFIYSF